MVPIQGAIVGIARESFVFEAGMANAVSMIVAMISSTDARNHPDPEPNQDCLFHTRSKDIQA
eukprot:6212749-Amphidinium_carterae.1